MHYKIANVTMQKNRLVTFK